jgi:hypothetical protein
MLRHKALIQCARIAFGFSGIADEDESILPQVQVNVTPTKPIFRKVEPLQVEVPPVEPPALPSIETTTTAPEATNE